MWSFAIIFLLLVSPCHAGEKWDRDELILLAAATTMLAVDWQQTRTIARCPETWEERVNPALARHPSSQSVDLWFATALLTEIVVAEILPPKWRKIWLGGWFIAEAGTTVYNFNIGIRF